MKKTYWNRKKMENVALVAGRQHENISHGYF